MPDHIIKIVRELRMAASHMRSCGLEANANGVFARARKIMEHYAVAN